jgi:hypothetical protein
MNVRRVVAVLTAGAAVALSAGLVSAPAGALESVTNFTTTVYDAGTSAPWSGSEVATASAYDTASFAGDGTTTPTGTVTYTFFVNGSCSVGGSSQTVNLNSDGSVPASSDNSGLGAGSYSYDASYSGDTTYSPATSTCETFAVGKATPTTPSISNIPSSPAYGGSFTASVSTNGDGTKSVASSTTSVCTVSGLTVSFIATGGCTLTASVSAGTDYSAATGNAQSFTVGQATPTVTITNIPTSGSVYGGSFVASVSTNGDGTTTYVTSDTTSVCTVGSDGYTVSYVGVGTCTLNAQVTAGTHYGAGTGNNQSFSIGRATPTAPTISNIPPAAYGEQFTADVSAEGDGTTSVASSTTGVCRVTGGLTVSFVGVGTCSLTASVATGTDYLAATGTAQTFTVFAHSPETPTITNIPSNAIQDGTYGASVSTNGDGSTYVISDTTSICTVSSNLDVYFVNPGTCTLTGAVSSGTLYAAGSGPAQSFSVAGAPRGYWLVGSDGGIFSFGVAGFYGSTGSLHLQRPVVGITPTSNKAGYWLDASDGGVFAFGDAGFYGSLPGLGLHPAGSGVPHSLAAPIVGMVPSTTGRGYFMVGSDGGVFAFGDAHFAGSCPGIGGCAGTAIAVMPDATGNGYWLVTSVGDVYAFGDAPFEGNAPPEGVAVTDAVASPGGEGYWILYSNGTVLSFGDAVPLTGPVGYTNSFDPATAVFPTSDGRGLWVASARGDVFPSGNAPFLGSMSATPLNGAIIAGFGF